MKQAFEFSTSVAGSGKQDDNKLFEDSVLRFCPFFNVLADKFQDRLAMVPKCNTDNLDFLHDYDAHDSTLEDSNNDSDTSDFEAAEAAASTKQYSSN